jgi:hypothetical protein
MPSSDLGGPDIAGLVGVAMMVFAYAASALGKLDPTRAKALLLNLIGSALVIYSLAYAWNVSSFVMEAVWFLVAAVGLVRLAMKR